MSENTPHHDRNAAPVRRSWVSPRVADLPRLTALTLQTGGGIPGGLVLGRSEGGSTVF